jgi:redox-sensitive bicupin YhaK (pirin superfamily)
VSPTGDRGSLRINQQTSIYDAKVEQGKQLVFQNKLGKAYWLQLISGELRLHNIEMQAGDGAAVMEEDIDFLSVLNSHLLLFELSTETGTN